MSGIFEPRSAGETRMSYLQTPRPFPSAYPTYLAPEEPPPTLLSCGTPYNPVDYPSCLSSEDYRAQNENVYFNQCNDCGFIRLFTEAWLSPIFMQKLCPQPPSYYQVESHNPHDKLSSLLLNVDDKEMEHDPVHGYCLYATNKFTPQPASIHPKNEFGHGKQEQVSDKRNSYAHILYTILKNAPDQSMTLQDIYESFKHVTTGKAQKEARSWKNSIRHVLSVNDAFERLKLPGIDKSAWRLKRGAMIYNRVPLARNKRRKVQDK